MGLLWQQQQQRTTLSVDLIRVYHYVTSSFHFASRPNASAIMIWIHTVVVIFLCSLFLYPLKGLLFFIEPKHVYIYIFSIPFEHHIEMSVAADEQIALDVLWVLGISDRLAFRLILDIRIIVITYNNNNNNRVIKYIFIVCYRRCGFCGCSIINRSARSICFVLSVHRMNSRLGWSILSHYSSQPQSQHLCNYITGSFEFIVIWDKIGLKHHLICMNLFRMMRTEQTVWSAWRMSRSSTVF